MAKKSELHADYNRCGDLSRRARLARDANDFRSALALAVEALPHLSGAVAYQRRFVKPEQVALPPAELILRLAPPLFARRPLVALAAWAGGLTRAGRAAVPDLPARLEAARGRHAAAVRAWAGFPARPAPPAAVLKVWLAAGLVERSSAGGFRRVSDPGRTAVGKCPTCGRRVVATLRGLLGPVTCLGCGRPQRFAVIARAEDV